MLKGLIRTGMVELRQNGNAYLLKYHYSRGETDPTTGEIIQ
jgi:hypothetical protein